VSQIRGVAVIVVLVSLIAACHPSAPIVPSKAPPPGRPSAVLLISLDAFRADFLDRGLTPNLTQLARDGVRAQWMTTSYPSLTFPNHYTIVTGLRPDHHGVIHNTMRDAVLGSFALGNREAVANGQWWGGEPVWVTAEKAGMPTATLFWPGSEAAIKGVRPRRWKVYDDTVPIAARVDTVVGWLAEPVATRPKFVTLYFETLDDAAHSHGPESPEVRTALVEVDRQIGRLLDGLKRDGQLERVAIVIVSDHGMAPVPPDNVVAVEDMVDAADATLIAAGQSVGFAPRPGRDREAEARLIGRHSHYECWRKADLPARWHYGQHPRVPPIVCQMHEGWDAAPRASAQKRAPGVTRGSHGFDPTLRSMRALFLARGPSLRAGAVVPPIDNVDVYPLLMSLLGLDALPHDGNSKAFATVMSIAGPADR
jgi:predicted AlkP superfamily pyrophosphatase or phosphodiesterase